MFEAAEPVEVLGDDERPRSVDRRDMGGPEGPFAQSRRSVAGALDRSGGISLSDQRLWAGRAGKTREYAEAGRRTV